MSATIVEMEEYCRKLFSLTEVGYRGERLRLLKLINGDAFFALKEWPSVTKDGVFPKTTFICQHTCPPTFSCWYVFVHVKNNGKMQKLSRDSNRTPKSGNQI